MILPTHIADRIRSTLAQRSDPGYPIDDEAASHASIALFGTLGAIWGLRADGTFWQFDADFDVDLSPLDEKLHVLAIVAGSERHPWLSELIPPRPDASRTCTVCSGRGNLRHVKGGGSYCAQCSGLGWLVA